MGMNFKGSVGLKKGVGKKNDIFFPFYFTYFGLK